MSENETIVAEQVLDEALDTLDTIVIFQGRTFDIQEPTTGIVIRILNVIGSLGVRSESAAAQFMNKPGSRAVAMGMMAVMRETDLIRLGAAVLQFENDKEGRKWIKSVGLRVAPLIKALFLNVSLSQDLVESLDSFLAGLGMVEGTLTAVTDMFTKAVPTTKTEEGKEKAGS